jgi:hypothetical protein
MQYKAEDRTYLVCLVRHEDAVILGEQRVENGDDLCRGPGCGKEPASTVGNASSVIAAGAATNVGCPWSGTVPPVCLLRERAWVWGKELCSAGACPCAGDEQCQGYGVI